MGRPTLTTHMEVVSYSHLCIKYPLPNWRVGVVRGDQIVARKCYAESVKVKAVRKKKGKKTHNCSFLDLKPRMVIYLA